MEVTKSKEEGEAPEPLFASLYVWRRLSDSNGRTGMARRQFSRLVHLTALPNLRVAADTGIEPIQTESKSVALPLG